MPATLLEACKAALEFIETGKNPAAGCVNAPAADVAIVEMLTHSIQAADPQSFATDAVEDYARGRAQVISRRCWEEQNELRRKSGGPEIAVDEGVCDAFARVLASWIMTASEPVEKLAFLKSKGLTVGTMRESGKVPYLAYVIEPGSELCDLETVRKLTDAEIAAKNWEETAAQNQRNADHYRGICEAAVEELGADLKAAACRCDDGTTADSPHLSKLPELVKTLCAMAYVWIPGQMNEREAQAVLDEITTRLHRAGYGFVADGTVYGNGILVNRLAVRILHDPTHPSGERLIPTQQENPDGLHGRYWIRKWDGRFCDPDAIYFVLRLDKGGSDPAHLEAGRFAARMYSLFLELLGDKAAHLQQLAKELAELCDKISYDERTDFPGFTPAEIKSMIRNPYAYDAALDYHGNSEAMASGMGMADSAAWHDRRREYLKSEVSRLMALEDAR